MKKIQTLFLRIGEYNPTYKGKLAYDVSNLVRPGCEWVLEGLGVATRKWDGTCCLVKEGKLWKRHTAKPGEYIPMPARGAADVITVDLSKGIVWLPVTDAPEDKWHREAWDQWLEEPAQDAYEAFANYVGTYELCGPKVNGNHEGLDTHVLIRHGEPVVKWMDIPTFDGIKAVLDGPLLNTEGIVWHHKEDEHLPYQDRRMAKIKRRDFGLPWPGCAALRQPGLEPAGGSVGPGKPGGDQAEHGPASPRR